MTDLEREVLDLAIRLEDVKLAVEEAFIRQKYKRAVRLLKKERRDAKAQKDEGQGSLR